MRKQDRVNKNTDNPNDAKEELLIQFLIDCSGSEIILYIYFWFFKLWGWKISVQSSWTSLPLLEFIWRAKPTTNRSQKWAWNLRVNQSRIERIWTYASDFTNLKRIQNWLLSPQWVNYTHRVTSKITGTSGTFSIWIQDDILLSSQQHRRASQVQIVSQLNLCYGALATTLKSTI